MTASTDSRSAAVDALWGSRPRSHFVQISLLLFAALVLAAWCLGGFDLSDTFSARRLQNFGRFVDELRPYPLRDRPWDSTVAADWVSDRMNDGGGWTAAWNTLAISILAVVLAAAAALLLCLPAARNFATAHPFTHRLYSATGHAQSALAWRLIVASTRLLLILLRSLPEYILAFLLFAMLGSPAWPAVLALAIHNAGILGRLDAETIENLDPRPLRALRSAGATRLQIATTAAFPATLPRLLLYFFYRWETCVREATVLGILGLSSLGLLIDEAHVRFRYDDMVFYVLIGVAIVLSGDILSALARRAVRNAS